MITASAGGARAITPGIHLLHKPPGVTSFSLVRAAMQPRLKVCHGGALDPFASGLLLLLVGEATKLFDHLHDVPKAYETMIRWGVETDNGDPLGRVMFEGDASTLSPDQIEAAMKPFIGWNDQIPPTTSNKRIAGERAYVKAHRGETFELPPTRVYLHEAAWLDHDLPRASRVRLVTRGGYYVRSLARDLGRALGCGAHLDALRRTTIGPWNDPGPDRSIEIRGRDLLPWLPSRELSDQEVGELRGNRPIMRAAGPAGAAGNVAPPTWSPTPGFPPSAPLIRAFHRDRLAFLLAPADAEKLIPKTALRGGI